MIIRSARPRSAREAAADRTAIVLAATAVGVAIAAWIFYLREGLVLSHYDAKGHLVVARRVIDNITPGWQQFGAVWLPLPHLVNFLPVQIDVFYRTGAFASAVSIACFGTTIWAASRLILRMTASRLGACVAAALLVLNPNVLYLQVTPMTEPLLLAVTFVAVLWLYEWVVRDQDHVPWTLGWALALAMWTRYEAWPIVAAALGAAVFAMWRRGMPPSIVARRAWRLGRWPTAAVLLFLINSRITVGEWFVSGGFYVPDPTYAGQAWRGLVGVWWGTHQLSGYVIESVALLMAGALVVRAVARREHAASLVPVALFAAAALPLAALYEGHPYRIRYMIPLVAACALFNGLAVGFVRARGEGPAASGEPAGPAEAGRYGSAGPAEAGCDGSAGQAGAGHYRGAARTGAAAPLLALVLVASAIVESPPWQEHAPLLSEAQWDVPISLNRRAVTACLAREYRGEKVLASMGSLAHYMQELSHEGLDIEDFIHEGNGVIWQLALEAGPVPHARWMLVEESAEGGDVLAQRIRQDPAFVDGMRRLCEGGGVALYAAE